MQFWGSPAHGSVVGCQPSTPHSEEGHFCFGDLAQQSWAAARVGVQSGNRQACLPGKIQRDMQQFVPARRWLASDIFLPWLGAKPLKRGAERCYRCHYPMLGDSQTWVLAVSL